MQTGRSSTRSVNTAGPEVFTYGHRNGYVYSGRDRYGNSDRDRDSAGNHGVIQSGDVATGRVPGS